MKVPAARPAPVARPQIDEVWLAMAASDLHDAGMLFEPAIKQDEGRTHADEDDVIETNESVKLPPSPQPDPETPPTRTYG